MAAKVALVTGGSSGIGEATALKLHELGYTTYAAARRVPRMEHLTKAGIRPLAMDVTDDQSLQSGVKHILDEQGRIDVLVNAAGYGSYGAIEDVPLSEARDQFEVNVFGAARLTQLVLPYMRNQHSGTIINITSMGGKIYTPLGGWYHATKFALEALSDCLRLEVKPYGINVVVIEPGGIRTEWPAIAVGKLKQASSGGPYARQADAVAASLASDTTARRSSPPRSSPTPSPRPSPHGAPGPATPPGMAPGPSSSCTTSCPTARSIPSSAGPPACRHDHRARWSRRGDRLYPGRAPARCSPHHAEPLLVDRSAAPDEHDQNAPFCPARLIRIEAVLTAPNGG